MKLLLAILISTSILSANFFAERDKQYHMTATFVISAFTGAVAKKHGYSDAEAFWIGFGTAMAIGLAKEAYDSRDGGTGFDGADMVANGIGGALGSGSAIIVYKF